MRVRHRAIGAAVVIAGGLGIAACSSSSTANPPSTTASTGAPSSSTPSTGSVPTSLSAVLLRAVQSTENQNSADIDMRLRVAVDGKVVGVTGSGSIDLANNAMQLTLNLHGLPTGQDDQAASVSVISVDGTTYVSSPEISKVLPGKSWLAQPSTSSSTTSGVQITNASDMLRILSARGAVITKVGAGTIGTTPVTAYNVRLSPAVISSRLSSVGISASDDSAIQKIFGNDGLTFRVYVSSANRIRRLSLSLALPANSGAPTNRETMVIDFTNYGTPVSITAPPASQVASLSQLEQGHTVG